MCLTFNSIFTTYQEAIRNVARYWNKNTIELKGLWLSKHGQSENSEWIRKDISLILGKCRRGPSVYNAIDMDIQISNFKVCGEGFDVLATWTKYTMEPHEWHFLFI